jgi:hypothetical protein
MVSLNVTATPESLHLRAHQAQLRARTADDWWDNALDTALAAVGSTRHPAGFREQGEGALDRLQRWSRDGEARRVSADTAALALAARAAADLARRDHDLESEAARAVVDLASRSGPAVPMLHLALCAWALDTVIPDRNDAPWPQIRAHFDTHRSSSSSSLEAPLRSLALTLANNPFDAPALVRLLLQQVPVSPGLEDAVILLWVTTVAIERCASEMPSDDAGLRALVDRRTELVSRLAQEVDSDAFRQPEVVDFDPEADTDLRPAIYLSPMEALLLDISLASTELDAPWLRFDEAKHLFGERGARAERVLTQRSAIFLTVVGFLTGAVLTLFLSNLGVESIVAVPAGLALASAGGLWASVFVHRNAPTRLTEAVGLFSATVLLVASFDTLNQALPSPLIPDVGGFIAGAIVAALILVIFFFFSKADH